MADEIRGYLRAIRDNFAFGLAGLAVLTHGSTKNTVLSKRILIDQDGLYVIGAHRDPQTVVTGEYYDLSPRPEKAEHAAKQFSTMLLRNLTQESLENLRDYCETTGQTSVMTAQPWYQFARMMRNALAHHYEWHFNNYDKSILPVSWRSKTIDLSMDGQLVDFEFFDWYDGLELWQDMYDFADTLS